MRYGNDTVPDAQPVCGQCGKGSYHTDLVNACSGECGGVICHDHKRQCEVCASDRWFCEFCITQVYGDWVCTKHAAQYKRDMDKDAAEEAALEHAHELQAV